MVKRKTRLKIFLAYAMCILMAVLLNMCVSYWQQTRMESSIYISDYEAMRYGTESMVWTLLTYGGIGLWLPRAISKELREDDEAERAMAEASKDAQTKEESALDCDVTIDTAESEMEPEVVSPEQEIKTDDTEQENDSAKDGKYAFERSEYVFRPKEEPKRRNIVISGAWAAFAVAPIIFAVVFVLVLLLNGGAVNEAKNDDLQSQQKQTEVAEQESNSNEELGQVPEIVASEYINQKLDEVEALEQAIEENRKEHYLAEYAQRINFEPEWAADAVHRKQAEYKELGARYIEALEQAIEENRENYRLAEFGTRAKINPEVSAYIMQQAQTEYEELNAKYQEALAKYEEYESEDERKEPLTGSEKIAEFDRDVDYTLKERIPTTSNVKEPNADAEHGEILVQPAYECVCPFTVETLSTGESYYIRLRHIEPGFNAEQKDTRNRVSQGDEDDIAVFCTGGKVEIDVPPGNYRLWYCSGDDWKGTDTYFGDDTVWYVSDDLLEFSVGLEYVYGNTVTLYPVLDGDFDTRVVDPDEIPEDF